MTGILGAVYTAGAIATGVYLAGGLVIVWERDGSLMWQTVARAVLGAAGWVFFWGWWLTEDRGRSWV